MTATEHMAELLKQAAVIVVRDGKASVTYLQRQLQIGYNLAATLMEALEAGGVVSAADAAGKRTILATLKGDEATGAASTGHPISNNAPDDDASFKNPDVLTAAAQGRLRTIIERIERLEEDKKAVMEDMKEVFAEAKGEGYDVKTLRKVVRLRKQDKAKRQEEEAILDLYLSALGEI